MLSYEAISLLVSYVDGRLVCKRTGKYRDTSRMTSGYAACKGSVGGVVYRDSAHRVVWFMHNGPIPDGFEIDHIDQDKLNNNITNLRLVTRSGNCHNMGNPVGVYFDKVCNNWYSNISINNKTTRIGSFDNILDARACYLRTKQELQQKEIK